MKYLLLAMSVLLFTDNSFALSIDQIKGVYRVTVGTPSSLLVKIQSQGSLDAGFAKLSIQQKYNNELTTCSGLARWKNNKKTILSSTVLCDSFESMTYEINFRSVNEFNNFNADVTIITDGERMRLKMNFIRLLGSDRR